MVDMRDENAAQAEIERLRRRVDELEQVAKERDVLAGELQRSAEHVRLFVTYTPAAVAMLDREMRYILVSDRWISDYRLGDRAILGRTHYEVFPEIPERWKEIHRRCLAGATAGCEEDPFPRADGQLDWVRWKIFPWHRTDGEIGGIIMFTEVITERKQMADALRTQSDKLRNVSMPIIPISDDILVMPIVGALDPERSQQMMEQLLGRVVDARARIAILDITGVPVVDTHSAGALIQISRAVRLLGAEVVLTGIRPEVAQALIGLEVDLASIVTRHNLQSGIAFAMSKR